jgi:hypothetical protein
MKLIIILAILFLFPFVGIVALDRIYKWRHPPPK